MLYLLRALIDRVKVMLLTIAAREIEQDVLIRQAEVQGGLLELAKLYDTGKQPKVADEIRQQLDATAGALEDATVDAAAAPASPAANGHLQRRLQGR